MRPSLVVVGGSWGGTVALRTVLRGLGDSFDAPIVVVLHRAARSNDELLERILRDGVTRDVCEVDDKTPLDSACVFIGPPDYHLLVEEGRLALSTDAPVNFSRPSIDVLFESLARDQGHATAACLLTGMGRDGALGLLRIREAGGLTIAQDEATSVVFGMPREAVALGAAEQVLPLGRVAAALAAAIGREDGAR